MIPAAAAELHAENYQLHLQVLKVTIKRYLVEKKIRNSTKQSIPGNIINQRRLFRNKVLPKFRPQFGIWLFELDHVLMVKNALLGDLNKLKAGCPFSTSIYN